MSEIELQQVFGGTVVGVDLSLGPGFHAIIGSAADGTEELSRLLLGVTRPRRGRVRIAGKDPHRDPSMRARVGALLDHEPHLPWGPTAGAAVAAMLASRGATCTAEQALESLDLRAMMSRPVGGLSAAERRSIAAAVIVASPSMSVACLVEPLARLPGVDRDRWIQALRRVAEAGVAVVVLTASVQDAMVFVSEAQSLEHGRMARRVTLRSYERDVEVAVRCSDLRALAARLTSSHDVLRVSWEDGATRELRVHGRGAAELGHAVLLACREVGVTLESMTPSRPNIAGIQAESAGLTRAAFEAAYRGARRGSSPEATAVPANGSTTEGAS